MRKVRHVKQFVREEELKLKFVKFMGKYFCELALVFGAGTGPGIYTDLAQISFDIAVRNTKRSSRNAPG